MTKQEKKNTTIFASALVALTETDAVAQNDKENVREMKIKIHAHMHSSSFLLHFRDLGH